MWPQNIKDGLETLFYAIAIVAAGASGWNYWRNSARDRTRWLFELYQRFYEQDALKNIWIQIDWAETAFIREEKDKNLLGKLDDFLNFFEFVGYLKQRCELKKKEIQSMFDYPLRKIAEDQAVLQYLRRYGYEQLDALLKDLRYAN